ncbi:MAG: hypothetical protein ACJ75I_11765 [Solirubrobacterales bacterium]
MRNLRAVALVATVVAALLAFASTAAARDPGRWVLTGASSVPQDYWQGLTNTPDESSIFFIGPAQGLWQTDPQLVQTNGVDKEIPTDLRQSVGYNHIGDPTWLGGEGGRIVLPMECFNPSADPSNTCGKGAFGIADAQTLAWRYYVQLDPKFIPKAMWAETSPDGKLIWTSAGDDLIAYKASQVSAANAAPSGPELKPTKRLKNAVPPSGITGAVFRKQHLLLAGSTDDTYQVWSVDLKTGDRTLQIETHICGESEGLGLFSTLGGRLHWLIAPSDDSGCDLTFGPESGLMHLRRSPGHDRFHVHVGDVIVGSNSESSELKVEVRARITRAGGKPVRGAHARFGGGGDVTNKHGRATIATTLERPGWFSVFARKDDRYGTSSRIEIGVSRSATPATSLSRR